METKEFLPLGSIIILERSPKYLMVTQRGVRLYSEEKDNYDTFDYGAVLYPEGQEGDKVLYFNQNSIFEVVARGFSDKQDDIYVAELNSAIQKLNNDPKE